MPSLIKTTGEILKIKLKNTADGVIFQNRNNIASSWGPEIGGNQFSFCSIFFFNGPHPRKVANAHRLSKLKVDSLKCLPLFETIFKFQKSNFLQRHSRELIPFKKKNIVWIFLLTHHRFSVTLFLSLVFAFFYSAENKLQFWIFLMSCRCHER